MKTWKQNIVMAVAVLLLAAPFSWAGGSSEKNAAPKTQGAPSAQPAPSAPAAPANPFFTGDGGQGRSITILPPRGVGLAENQAYLPDFVANELVSNFSSFSAMTLFDRVNNQKQYDELLSGYYSDNDKAGLDLGHLESTEYMLLGDITRTSSGFALQLTVNRNSDKTTAATYSGTVTIDELNNLTGVRRASLDLLQKMGVQVTERGRTELGMAATEERVNAQTAAARGIVAQQLGNAAEALAQFYQAAAYDPSLAEAAARANTMSASVRTGSLGANIRNDIAWRDEWVKILAEAQTSLRNIPAPPQPPSPPQQIVVAQIVPPEPVFKQESIDYTARTAALSVQFDPRWNMFSVPYPPEYRAAFNAYSAAYAARAGVYNKIVADINAGLRATKRNADWKLAELSSIERDTGGPGSPRSETVAVSAVVELLNDKGRVIGNAGNAVILGRFGFGEWSTVLRERAGIQRFAFTVKADDISDQMTLRFTAAASPAPNNIVQVMSFTELKAARPDLGLTTPGAAPQGMVQMVRINGGTFQMGSKRRYTDEDPVHTVTITGFYMGKYEVTQAEWTAVMGSNPSEWKGDNLPVGVSWYDAVEFCNQLSQSEGLIPAYTIDKSRKDPNNKQERDDVKWVVTWNRNADGYRLPTEAEWEYAARGGNGSPGNYTYSGSNIAGQVAWYDRNYGHSSHEVGTKKPNGLGLYDMSGNVEEWCWDWYDSDYYRNSPQNDPTGASSGSYRVLRGGHRINSAADVRSAYRSSSNPSNRYDFIGFRLVRP